MSNPSVLSLDPAFPTEDSQSFSFEKVNCFQGFAFGENDFASRNRLYAEMLREEYENFLLAHLRR